jgi:hypothetical protein
MLLLYIIVNIVIIEGLVMKTRFIVARMSSRIDAKKIKGKPFSSHKRQREPADKPLDLCPAGGTGQLQGFWEFFMSTSLGPF